jgi:hypothetical protein
VKNLLGVLCVFALLMRPCSAAPPVIGKSAPAFSLPDTNGKIVSSQTWRGQVIVLFFFCGCEACYEVGKEWASLQRGGALNSPPAKTTATAGTIKARRGVSARTVVVYSELSPSAARSMADSCGFPSDTLILVEERGTVVKERFGAMPCPRVFLLDNNSILRYTNPPPVLSDSDTNSIFAATTLTAPTLTVLRTMIQTAAKPVPTNKANGKQRTAKQTVQTKQTKQKKSNP